MEERKGKEESIAKARNTGVCCSQLHQRVLLLTNLRNKNRKIKIGKATADIYYFVHYQAPAASSAQIGSTGLFCGVSLIHCSSAQVLCWM